MSSYIITESQFERLFQKLLNEDVNKTINIAGTIVTINPDGTLTIANKKKQNKKVRLYVEQFFTEFIINVTNIEKTNNGYTITGKSGRSEEVDDTTIMKVIEFVNKNKEEEKIESNLGTIIVKLIN